MIVLDEAFLQKKLGELTVDEFVRLSVYVKNKKKDFATIQAKDIRKKLLEALKDKGKSMYDLHKELTISYALVRYHIKMMEQERIVTLVDEKDVPGAARKSRRKTKIITINKKEEDIAVGQPDTTGSGTI